MCAGRVVDPASAGRPMAVPMLWLAFMRDTALWAGGTVAYYLGCRWWHLPESVSNGAVTLGMGVAVTVLGFVEVFPARRRVRAVDWASGTTTHVVRHRMMAFGLPVLTTLSGDGKPIQV
jgi:hypothetical protein